MGKVKFYVQLVVISLVLIMIQHFTGNQNSKQGINTTRSLGKRVLSTVKENSTSWRLSPTNKRTQGKTLTDGSSGRLPAKLREEINSPRDANSTTSSEGWNFCVWNPKLLCINYHQCKAVIYPKYIPDNNLDMVMFIPSQHGDSSFQRRQFLRKFPLNSTYFPQIKTKHVFVFGKFSLLNFVVSIS